MTSSFIGLMIVSLLMRIFRGHPLTGLRHPCLAEEMEISTELMDVRPCVPGLLLSEYREMSSSWLVCTCGTKNNGYG